MKTFNEFINESSNKGVIPKLTKSSSWSDIESYLKWLAKSDFAYHIEDDPKDIENFDKDTVKILTANSNITWGFNDRPENKNISDKKLTDMIWDVYNPMNFDQS